MSWSCKQAVAGLSRICISNGVGLCRYRICEPTGPVSQLRKLSCGRVLHKESFTAESNRLLTEEDRKKEVQFEEVSEVSVSQASEVSESIKASPDSSPMSGEPAISVPWYLRKSFIKEPTFSEPIPEFPLDSPECIDIIIPYLIKDLGLVDIEFVDLRNRPELVTFQDTIMIVCTGKSDKHLTRSAMALSSWIKSKFKVIPMMEGITTSNFLRVQRRRLARKAKRHALADDEYGIVNPTKANSWIMLDSQCSGVFVHFFTADRRSEVDLSGLWNEEKPSKPPNPERIEKFDRLYMIPKFTTESSSNPSIPKKRNYSTAPLRSASYSTSNITIAQETRGFPNERLLEDNPDYIFSLPAKDPAILFDKLKIASCQGDYNRCKKLVHGFEKEFQEKEENAVSLILKAHINALSSCQSHQINQLVVSFALSFPGFPSHYHWKLAHIFYHRCNKINPKEIPLKILAQNLMLQQASGIVADDWDVEYIISAIVNSGRKVRNRRSWSSNLQVKASMIFSILDFAYRSQGKKIVANTRILGLLYRLCIPLHHDTLTASEALKSFTPSNKHSPSFQSSKSFSVLKELLLENGGHNSRPFVIMTLTALANNQAWPKFWIFWSQLSNTVLLDQELVALMASLVVKSGDLEAITHLLDVVIPEALISGVKVDKTMSDVLTTAVEVIDPHNIGYKRIRQIIRGC